jgi:hypothetical protein
VLTKNATIRVPIDTSGNLGGLYAELASDPKYFRIVNLADPAFEFRPVYFQLDGEFLDAFQDAINFVSVNFRKNYPGQPAYTKSIQLSRADLDAGRTTHNLQFPRLGMSGADWTQYEYQVRWSLRGGPTLSVPAKEDAWIKSSDAAVSLTPPMVRRVVEIEADRQLFKDRGMNTAVVEFAVMQGGKPKLERKATLRVSDATPTSKVSVYADKNSPIAYRVSWHSAAGSREGKLAVLESDYLFLSPPSGTETSGAPAGGGQ